MSREFKGEAIWLQEKFDLAALRQGKGVFHLLEDPWQSKNTILIHAERRA